MALVQRPSSKIIQRMNNLSGMMIIRRMAWVRMSEDKIEDYEESNLEDKDELNESLYQENLEDELYR